MVKDFPCPCCCKHVEIPATIWDKGGVVKCPSCGYNTKFSAHPPVSEVTADDIMLRKKVKPISEKPLTKEELDAIFPKRETNPIIVAKQMYDSLNPRPIIEFSRTGPDGKPSVMVGLKFNF